MKAEENQGFTSFDFFTLVVSMAIIVGVSAPIIKKNFQPDNSIEIAKQDLDRIGHLILNPGTLNALAQNYREGNIRSIASVDDQGNQNPTIDLESIQRHLKSGKWDGEIGKDPWGRPYHYTFLKNAAGLHTHVAVWSDGPNQKSETALNSQIVTDERPEHLVFQGDDVGTIFPIR